MYDSLSKTASAMLNDGPRKTQTAPAVPTEALRRAVQASPLAVGLLHLPSRRFLELSQRATALLGLESVDLSGFDVLRLSKEPDATRRAWDLVVDGVLDGYRARRALSVGADEIDSYLGVRTVARGGDCSRSVSVVTDPVPQDEADDARDAVVIVGIASESQRIENASSDTKSLSGHPPAEYLLASIVDIVHPDDVSPVLQAFEAPIPSADTQVAVRVRCGDDGTGRLIRLVVTRLGENDDCFRFTVAPVDGAPPLSELDRDSGLEGRLRRIASEIEAVLLGFDRVPDLDRVPGVANLTSRQWEVLTRLLSGERVPGIARALYVSPSTVRNHLSTIFRKFGVHTQAELIARLRRPE